MFLCPANHNLNTYKLRKKETNIINLDRPDRTICTSLFTAAASHGYFNSTRFDAINLCSETWDMNHLITHKKLFVKSYKTFSVPMWRVPNHNKNIQTYHFFMNWFDRYSSLTTTAATKRLEIYWTCNALVVLVKLHFFC